MDRRNRTDWAYNGVLLTAMMMGFAVVVWVVPGLRNWLVFDREAILHGQVWRIVTGEFVHFSVSHLVCDAAMVAMAGAAMERLGRLRHALLCLVASVAIGLGVFVLKPEVRFYGGLSGLAMCFVVVWGMEWLRNGKRGRWLGLLLLAVVGGKLFVESGTTDAVFVNLGNGVVRSSTAHWVGALVGLMRGVVTYKKAPAAEIGAT